MAFHEIERGSWKTREALKDTVGVWVSAQGVASITISGDLYKKIGSPAFVKVMLGSGEHSGFVALIPRNMPAGAYKVTKTSAGSAQMKLSITASRLGLLRDKRPTMHLPHEITEDGLIVDLRPIRPVVTREPAHLIKSARLAAAQ